MGSLALANWFVGPAAPAAPATGPSDRPVIAVVDDDDGARISTEWLLESEGYRVLSFASGEAFLASRLLHRVACVLLDMRMPGLGGLDVLRALAGRDDAPAVLVLTGHANLATAVAAMKLRAADFIEKPYAPAALLRAVERAATLGERARISRARRGEARVLVDGLPERQRQVLSGMTRGRPNKVIAWELGLSVRTVETYRAQMLDRLRVRSTAEAVRIALAAGLDRQAAPQPAALPPL
jgi:two-component system, LuxR family, response regulator FixJ